MSTLKTIIKKQAEARPVDTLEVRLTATDKAFTSVSRQLASIMATEARPNPKVPKNLANSLANALNYLWSRIHKMGIPYSPFVTSPTWDFSHPQGMLDYVNDKYREKLSRPINLADLKIKGMYRSNVEKMAEGRQIMTADQLESVRRTIWEMYEIPEMEPNAFLAKFCEGLEKLYFGYPVDRLEQWATRYAPKSVFVYPKTELDEYLILIVKAWRLQWLNNKFDHYDRHKSFFDLLGDRTKLRRLGRGMDHVVHAIFNEQEGYNTRLKPVANVPRFRRMLEGRELGLTADSIMGICLMTGISPLSVLLHFAHQELELKGSPSYHLKHSARDMVEWRGSLDPHQYQILIDYCVSLGLVPDQHKFVLGLMSAGYVYANLPSIENMSETIPPAYHYIAEGYCNPFMDNYNRYGHLSVPYKVLTDMVEITDLLRKPSRVLLSSIYCLGMATHDISGKVKEQIEGMHEDSLVDLAEEKLQLETELTYSSDPIPIRTVSTFYAGLNSYMAD